jgi:hypothetical protein
MRFFLVQEAWAAFRPGHTFNNAGSGRRIQAANTRHPDRSPDLHRDKLRGMERPETLVSSAINQGQGEDGGIYGQIGTHTTVILNLIQNRG